MGLKALKRAKARADRLQAELDHAHLSIAMELRKISGVKNLTIGNLAGDGLGVFLSKSSDAAAPLGVIIALIEIHGTITGDDIADLSCL